MEMQKHWEAAYSGRDVATLGWHEPLPLRSLEMIREAGVGPDEMILDVGAGASHLLGLLYARGHRRLAALDISSEALARNRAALPPAVAAAVRWVTADITATPDLTDLAPIALWHDRATLHFLRDDAARHAYRDLLTRAVPPGCHAVIATFAPEGATHCSGLEVRRYSHADLESFLGEDWKPLRQTDWTYHNPRGEPRPYSYGLFRRLP